MGVEGVGGRCEGEGGHIVVGGGGKERREGGGREVGGRGSWGRFQPTKNRRDLSLPKPDPVWAPSHPKIHQNTTKKGKISKRKREKEKCEVGGKFEKGLLQQTPSLFFPLRPALRRNKAILEYVKKELKTNVRGQLGRASVMRA